LQEILFLRSKTGLQSAASLGKANKIGSLMRRITCQSDVFLDLQSIYPCLDILAGGGCQPRDLWYGQSALFMEELQNGSCHLGETVRYQPEGSLLTINQDLDLSE
jgi:hypothetical protein